MSLVADDVITSIEISKELNRQIIALIGEWGKCYQQQQN